MLIELLQFEEFGHQCFIEDRVQTPVVVAFISSNELS